MRESNYIWNSINNYLNNTNELKLQKVLTSQLLFLIIKFCDLNLGKCCTLGNFFFHNDLYTYLVVLEREGTGTLYYI